MPERDELLEQYMLLQKAQARKDDKIGAGSPLNNKIEAPSVMGIAGKPNPVVNHAEAVKQFEKVEGPKPTIAGNKPTEKSDAELAREGVTNLYQRLLDQRKDDLLQQRSDSVRMAQFNALGNALRAMVQPLGWAAGGGESGVTAPVQNYDNRQYLEAFNRAVKATDDLRNLNSEGAAFQLDMAQRNADRIQSRKDKEEDKLFDAKIKAEYAKERHRYTMEEIAARGDVQTQVAKIRASNVKKNGKTITEANLKTAKTQWFRYLGRYWDDIGRGIVRKEKRGPLSFGEFLTTPEGGGYSVDYSGSNSIDWEDSGAASSSASAPTIQWE